MMWFKRESKEKNENGGIKLRRKKAVVLRPTRETERETSTESEKERRRYSDILDMKVSLERRDLSDESLYESADGHSDAISASDDAIQSTVSKESLKITVTDEEFNTKKKGHKKTMSLSNALEMKGLTDWQEAKTLEKKSKSKDSLYSEEDESRKEKNRKSLENKTRKVSKGTSGPLNFLRRKKTVKEDVPPKIEPVPNEIIKKTQYFLEAEMLHSSQLLSTDVPEVPTTPKRRLSRQTSRGKSKVRGKSQSVRVNTLRKTHSGTLKRGKKKIVKTPSRSRISSVDVTPLSKTDLKKTSWFSYNSGEPRREGSAEETIAADGDNDASDSKELDKEHNVRTAPSVGGRGVNRAESCRERDAPRRGKHRNASDPNRLTAHNNHDLEGSGAVAPSVSSSSSSLSTRSNDSNTLHDQQASQSDWSEEEDPLAPQWQDSLPPTVLDTLLLSPKLRKRQELIHELIVSEASHVRWLKVLYRVFYRPLERQPSLLPPEELRALFPNLQSVKERHVKLYADLRAARSESNDHVVGVQPVAEAILNTLGDANYATCVSRFCRGQRMALDLLRERRRKSKELSAFLASREQLPLCARLQLADMLACVWQRLTKYKLLLDSITKSITPEECLSDETVASIQRAVEIADDVLQSVNTAIRKSENEHRLKTIQSKLEVRASGEWDELRRLDLTAHSLRTEGELGVRLDGGKRVTLLALMLEDMLVLLHRDGDKYVLKPMTLQSTQQLLSPVIRWDKVLFRPNAAQRYTFFLIYIDGVQMHELSANTATEYATWVKHIQEAPLAKITPAHARSIETTGTNISRNPSDASEKSSTSEEVKGEREGSEEQADKADEPDKADDEKAADDTSGDDKVCRVGGRVVSVPDIPLCMAQAIDPPPAFLAEPVYTQLEQLRRVDTEISRLLTQKSSLVADLLGVPCESYTHLADLAVADTMGDVDVYNENTNRFDGDSSDLKHFLLAAHTQVQQLTELLSSGLSVNETTIVSARAAHASEGDRLMATNANSSRTQENKCTCPPEDQTVSSSSTGYLPLDVSSRVAVAQASCLLAPKFVPALSVLSAALGGALRASVGAVAARADGVAARDAADAAAYFEQHRNNERSDVQTDQSIQGLPNNGG